MGKTIFTSLSGTSISILQPFAKILDIFISFPPSGLYNYYELTIACSPVGLIGSMDRALRPTIAKVSVWLPSTHEFCPFFFPIFFFNRPTCLYNCEDHFLFHTLYLILAFKNGLSTILCLWSSFLPPSLPSCHQYKTMKTWRNNFERKGERGWVLHLTEVQIAAIWSKKGHILSECLNIYATGRSWLLLLLIQSVKLVV